MLHRPAQVEAWAQSRVACPARACPGLGCLHALPPCTYSSGHVAAGRCDPKSNSRAQAGRPMARGSPSTMRRGGPPDWDPQAVLLVELRAGLGTPRVAELRGPLTTKGGWAAAIVFLKADLEAWQNEIGLMSVSALVGMCSHCLADRRLAGSPWCDFRRGAAWRDTVSGTC